MAGVMYPGCSKALDTVVVLTSRMGHGGLDAWIERQIINCLGGGTRRTVVSGAYGLRT